jgi:cellobiose phosphorylase
VHRYRVEPYVVAADVYSEPPGAGRGGWTWYTGSAGWMYRLVLESLLGIHLEVDRLRIAPRMPAEWPGFEVHYRFRDTHYHIAVTRHAAPSSLGADPLRARITHDGVPEASDTITLVDDRRDHRVEVWVA